MLVLLVVEVADADWLNNASRADCMLVLVVVEVAAVVLDVSLESLDDPIAWPPPP